MDTPGASQKLTYDTLPYEVREIILSYAVMNKNDPYEKNHEGQRAARLHSVSKQFSADIKGLLRYNAHIGKSYTRQSIAYGSHLSPEDFRNTLEKAFEARHIEIDIKNMSPENQNIIGSHLINTKKRLTSLHLNFTGSHFPTQFLSRKIWKMLTRLNLAWCKINDTGATAIGHALAGSRLTDLNLSGNPIGDAGATAISRALPHSKLTHLTLRFTHIGDTGAIAIAQTLPRSRLANLNMISNEIGHTGAAAIAQALPDSKLIDLDIGGNPIGDIGTTALAEALPHSRLTHLTIDNNEIGAAGGIAIAKALPHCRLTHLRIDHNEIGSAGVTALAEASPDSRLIDLGMDINESDEDDGA